ncbi:hypothetical protein LLG10_04770 [bacterium]|nr:hypothetical protein [bacterium]
MKNETTMLFFNKAFLSSFLVILSLFFYPSPLSKEVTTPLSVPSVAQESATVSNALILGQNLLVGIPGLDLDKVTADLLREIKPGGVVLYQRNFRDFTQLKNLIQSLQSLAVKTTGYPYYIMLDEEPEGALRTGLLKNIFPLGYPNWKKINEDIRLLAMTGINVELAPLADFPFLPNSFISKRIPFNNQEDMMTFNRSFIQIMKQNNIQATVKHFPGLGMLSDDPHYQVVTSSSTIETIEKSMKLFRDAIQGGATFVMTSHALYDHLDKENLATFSKVIVTDKLQHELGFEGIIITDDISDMPLSIKGLNIAEAGIKALEAGHHMILYSHQLSRTKRVVDVLLLKAGQDNAFLELLTHNYNRIIENKQRHLPIPAQLLEYE